MNAPAISPLTPSAKCPLPAPEAPVDVLIVAGEHSGDAHAATLVRELRQQHPGWHIAALGGPALQAAGAQLLFELTAHAVVGVAEVLKHYAFFKNLMEATVAWVAEHRPRAICYVDYPGFNLRLAKRLKALPVKPGLPPLKQLYYIGPQLWAWKQHRRFQMAETLDALAVIFPFETEVYQDTALPVQFVGHPMTLPEFAPSVCYEPNGPLLLLPGSRRQAVSRIAPRLLEAFARYRAAHPEARAVMLYPSEALRDLLTALPEWPTVADAVRLEPVTPNREPIGARAALMSSGTMSLEVALAGIPGAICYVAHPFTYWLGRMLVKVPYLGMANLLLKQAAWPEYLQQTATPDNLRAALETATAPQAHAQAQTHAQLLRQLLGTANASAAQWLIAQLAQAGSA